MKQEMSALEVYLQDLQRAGVTDFAADIPFNALTDKIEKQAKPAPAEAVSAEVVPAVEVSPVEAAPAVDTVQAKPAEPVAPYAASAPALKPTKKAAPAVWSVGAAKSKTELQVIAFNRTVGAKKAFAPQVNMLFEKMMEAILQPLEGIRYVMHSDTEDMAEHIMAEIDGNIPVLLVGQDSCAALAGKTLSALRDDTTLANITTLGVVPHPSLLLKQPVLKRTAWQDLLKFVEKWEANA